MADITELERQANQYISEHVAGGGKREDVLADWIKSDNPDLQKYAKSLLVKDLEPPQAPTPSVPQSPSYMDMAKDMAPVIGPAAGVATAVGVGSYLLGKKRGQGIAPPSSSTEPSAFDLQRQQLELEKMQAQIDTERARAARYMQMSNQGQTLPTQAKFSEPTLPEVVADTTSVKVPSPATVEAEVNEIDALKQRAADLNASLQGKPGSDVPGAIARNPLPANPSIFSSSVKAPGVVPQTGTATVQPSVETAVATGGNVNQAIQQTVAQEIDKPVTLAPTPAPAPAPAPEPAKAKGKPVAPPAAPVELRTGSGFPAFAGTGEAVGDVKNWRAPKGGNIDFSKLPSDLVFVPNMGPGLNTARQTLGQEGAQLLAQQLGAPWGADAETRQRLAEFNENRVGPPLTRDQRKAVKAPPLPNTSGINMKTGLKSAGVAGVVMSIADIAKAESAQQRQEAIGNALLGLLSPTMAVNQAGAPGVAMSEDVYKLGSPYYQSEEAKRYRQGQQVGAGRGIAPPSAYQR